MALATWPGPEFSFSRRRLDLRSDAHNPGRPSYPVRAVSTRGLYACRASPLRSPHATTAATLRGCARLLQGRR